MTSKRPGRVALRKAARVKRQLHHLLELHVDAVPEREPDDPPADPIASALVLLAPGPGEAVRRQDERRAPDLERDRAELRASEFVAAFHHAPHGERADGALGAGAENLD